MTKEKFIESLNEPSPPEGLHSLMLALWYDAKGEWDKAHNIVQNLSSKAASWIHAYLHRKEGDIANAKYWYMRAEKEIPDLTIELTEEWDNIVSALEDFLKV